MTTANDLQDMKGRTAVDANGAKLGKVGQVYVNDQTGEPAWVTVSTGLFGTRESFAPLYRIRLRKHVVTENVTQTVPVSHEEVRLEREPITDANRGQATSGADISEEEHELTLHAERPVTAKETVPVERVRLGTQTVTEDQQVTETVRKEQIDDPDTTR